MYIYYNPSRISFWFEIYYFLRGYQLSFKKKKSTNVICFENKIVSYNLFQEETPRVHEDWERRLMLPAWPGSLLGPYIDR